MVKKVAVKRKVTPKKSPHKVEKKTNINAERILIENFVALQKVMANLSSKFDNLAEKLSKLLELFEISAKALAEKEFKIERGESDKRVAEKLDKLLDQNKIIARGLTLLHEPPEGYTPAQQPLPQPPALNPQPSRLKKYPIKKESSEEIRGYQKSISSQNKDYEE